MCYDAPWIDSIIVTLGLNLNIETSFFIVLDKKIDYNLKILDALTR